MRARFNAAELAAVVAKTLSSIDVRTTSVLVEGRWQNVMKDEQHSLGHRRGLSPGQDRLIEIREHNRPRVRGLPARRLHLSIVLDNCLTRTDRNSQSASHDILAANNEFAP